MGQLVAGVAHEINNPVNFIHSNITYLNEYTQDLLRMIHLYQQPHPSNDPEVQALAEEIDLEFYQIITKKHGGKLECFSTLGEGSEFIIQLPTQQQVSTAA